MDAQAYLGLWCLHIMWGLSWHVSNVSISYCKHSKKLDSKILLHGKKIKKKNYMWDVILEKLVTSTLSTFVKEVIYSCTVQKMRVLTIVQVRDLHAHVLGYKGLPFFLLIRMLALI